MLIGIDIMTLEQFVLDFSKKTAFIDSYSCLFDLHIEIPQVSIQRPVYTKARATILSHTMQVILIHHLDIPRSREFLYQLDNFNFAFSAHLVNTDITGFLVEKNIDKPIYVS